jgi:hypothetical protein
VKRSIYKSITLLTVLSAVILLSACQSIEEPPNFQGKSIAPVQTDYPHWDFNNWATYRKLVKINTFIEVNKNKGKIAVFDWDGTLYNENIPVKEMGEEKFAGQPAYYIWGAYNTKEFSFPVFPMFITKDGDYLNNVINFDKYLEGRTNIHPDQYSKFTQTAMFTAGMSTQNMSESVSKYLDVYSPKKYAFLPMLDVLQKMINSGFKVWIITGSNQYFVAVMLDYIEKNIDYDKEKYDFNLCEVPYNAKTGKIAGNGLKLMKNDIFSVVYDNIYVKGPGKELYIVDDEGKVIAGTGIEKKEDSTIAFVAGNSGGDYYIMKHVVAKPDTLAIAVEARGKLPEVVKQFPEKIVSLNSEEI